MKIDERKREAIQLAYDTFLWTKENSPLKKTKPQLKKIDFCRRIAQIYSVHYKTIERIIAL